ncbi:hypothetical protein Bca4012_065484 [Brassica carinata]
MQALQNLVEPQDVKIIEKIPLSKLHMEDREGWHFTNNGKYTVQSGYQVERIYPDKVNLYMEYGPTAEPLKANCWKVRCPPKMKHFLWQLVSGCIAVKKNLRSRGIHGDICCNRCGAPEETINHVFFECPPAVQVWALSRIPSNPNIFPMKSLFANMDHLFWRISPKMEEHTFAWILWYIWKARNNKVFSNLDVDPRDTLKLAEVESKLWLEAQNSITKPHTQENTGATGDLPIIPGRWCFTDGSWKAQEVFSGQGWYSTLEGFDGLMGARNTRASQSPLHSEIEAFIWAMECMKNLRQFHVTFATDCTQLVKMVSEPEEWPAFATYLEDIRVLRESFHHSELLHISRTHNGRADSLARSVRKQPTFVVYMDAELPEWVTESV